MNKTGLLRQLKNRPIFNRPIVLLSICLSVIFMTVMMLAFNYMDGRLNLSWSIELLDAIFRKTEVEFYEYSGMGTRRDFLTFWNCDKTILVMLPLALWNIPVWIVHEISGQMMVAGLSDVVWMEIGFVIAIIITSSECCKIVKIVNPDSDPAVVFALILGSFDVVCSTMYAGQDEIIYLMFLVTAVRCIMEERMGRFLLFATLSVALNPEMIVPILFIVVFIEKRPLFILMNMLITVIPSVMFSLLFKTNDVYHEFNWMDEASNELKGLFTTDVALSQNMGNVSLFIVVLCVLLFFTVTGKKSGKWSDLLWVLGVVMVGMTLLSSGTFLNHFYRSILYVPFMVMIIASSKQNLRTNLLLYCLYSVCRGWMCLHQTYPQNMGIMSLSFQSDYINKVIEKSGRLVVAGYYS